MNIEDTYQALRPIEWRRIYELVRDAGVDVRPWEESKRDGSKIEPHTNTHQNSRWTFGGGDQPLVACIWWDALILSAGNIERVSSSKHDMQRMSELQSQVRNRDATAQRRLTVKIGKAQEFDRLISEAFRKRKPVRVIVVDGNRTDSDELAASVADRRLLDPASWYVHSYDPYEGDYRLVRDVLPPPMLDDPFDGAEDPADNHYFRELMASDALGDTERHALMKARVGQGYFRDALIERWHGCSVTGCTDTSLLIASHIKPWSECVTRAERLSPDNGLLLTPNLDKLFDRGLITFSENVPYNMILSRKLGVTTRQALNVQPNTRLGRRVAEGMTPFLEYHRMNVFVDGKTD